MAEGLRPRGRQLGWPDSEVRERFAGYHHGLLEFYGRAADADRAVVNRFLY
ncbi:hypothetical protein ACWD6R_11950 [Streptomyces sp. NPDC005151]